MKSLLLTFAVSLLAAACSAPPYPAYAIENDAEATAQVVVADASLQAVVRAGRPLVERTQQGDFLRVVVPIRNVDDEPIWYWCRPRSSTTNASHCPTSPTVRCCCCRRAERPTSRQSRASRERLTSSCA